ncbi:glutathione S-transferase [Xylariales sp. PMI_506]|nr:glutathione S-transferase [Xylariales sp. PMI_506]
MANLTIHHLQVSQSERIIWLCEELGIPYTLKTYKRSPVLAPPEYKALHFAGTAPVIQDHQVSDGSDSSPPPPPLTLAESCACIEYICRKHAGGRLFLGPEHPQFADFLYWFHWANGTFMPSLVRLIGVPLTPAPSSAAAADTTVGDSSTNRMQAISRDRLKRALNALDEKLKQPSSSNSRSSSSSSDDEVKDGPWLTGDEFTAADIMVVFPLTTMRYFTSYSLQGHPNIVAYLQRVAARPAYRRAMAAGDPDMELVLGADAPQKSAL